MATLNTFMLMTATSTPTKGKVKRIVAFQWKEGLGERATI
jgi:hypothetical protein